MSVVEVLPVRSRREEGDFLELPWRVYAGDPYWIPPLRFEQRELVGFKRHPFYDDASRQAFVAYRAGRACGRILAVVNPSHNRRHEEQRGFWGFFESVDDPEVATALFDAARDWLRGQGMTAMRGPTNPTMNYTCGLLVDGFDSPPTFMMTYNPAYYPRLVEGYGMQRTQDLLSFWGHVEMLQALDKKLEFVVGEAKSRFQIETRPLNRRKFADDLRAFLHIYNASLVGTWGFAPMSDRELEQMAAGLKHLIVPELAIIAEVAGRPIGATFGLLDYNPRIKQIDGRLFPFGFVRLLWNKSAIKKVRIISTNVLPEYQQWGVGLVLVNALVPKVLEWGIQQGEFSWVLESNHLSRKTLERGGAKLEKTFRLYDLEIS